MVYSLSIEENYILIRKIGKDYARCLRISYDFQIQQINLLPKQNTRCQKFHAILGIKVIKSIPFLVVIKQHDSICAFQGSQIYELKSIGWIPLIENNIQKLPEKDQQQIQAQLDSISKIFEQGLHYYSDNYELNKPFLLNIRKNTNGQIQYYKQFIFNRNIIKIDVQNQFMIQKYKLVKSENSLSNDTNLNFEQYKRQQQIFQKWCVPIIQGYVNTFQTILPDKVKLQFLIISRRSAKKAGTRFFSRGIEDYGNVANYTQTEQIIQYQDLVFTSLQIRGSVPVFFEQIGMQGINIQLNIQRSKQLAKKAWMIHFNNFREQYGRGMCVNLLSNHKKSQKKLTQFYEEMLKFTEKQLDEEVQYEYFDFHQQCKNNEFSNSYKLITRLLSTIQNYGFNCYDRESNKLLKVQCGIFRTNCLDCLDRTNYVQSRIALQIFKNMLVQYGSKQLGRYIQEYQIFKQQTEMQLNSQVLNQFNCLWGDNGDSVSLHYTGIGSTHTDITKVGKRTIFGTVNHKMRSLMRFYTQFTDVKKHQTINKFLGNKSNLKFDSNINTFSQTNQEKLLIISWQFSEPQKSLAQFQRNPHNNRTYQYLSKQLNQAHGSMHALVIIYLYIPNEMINWSAGINFKLKQLLNPFKNPYIEVINKWGDFVTQQLQSFQHKFALIETNQSDSCKMLIFCKKSLIQFITNIRKDQIISKLKTKQSVLLTKFNFCNSSLVFQGFNVKNTQNFTSYLEEADSKGFQQNVLGRQKSTSIKEQSYRVILGNVGSQSKLMEDELKRMEEELQISKVLSKNKNYQSSESQTSNIVQLISKAHANDEVKMLMEKCQNVESNGKKSLLANYNQGPLEFIPHNNRIFFWNEVNKIIRIKSYNKIKSFFAKEDGFKKQKQKQNQDEEMQQIKENSVYLELSYEIQMKKSSNY